MHLAKLIVPVIAAVFTANSALGAQSLVFPTVIDNSGGGAPLAGFITMDVTIQSDTDWTAAAILLELTRGSIYQDTFGGDVNAPSAAIINAFPSAEFDTYVGDPHNGASIAGGALDIPGAGLQEFSTSRLSVAWNSAGADTADVGLVAIARITLSSDANGHMALALTEAGSTAKTLVFVPFVNGVITPEPASLALLGLGGLAVLRRR